ncbi:hypothetical protein [Qipengyuania sp. YIM B01966]|uniref:hypothetical protein n=1 Tax=Qipengyuania sp. YIM B01966 TaxID=2778646 RepID=UPI0018F4BCFE|nr:hypothetical protein [Qipengyuania sp. YIM B01966]
MTVRPTMLDRWPSAIAGLEFAALLLVQTLANATTPCGCSIKQNRDRRNMGNFSRNHSLVALADCTMRLCKNWIIFR